MLIARIENLALDILDLLLEAYYGPVKDKRTKILAANMAIKKLRRLLRLAYELKYLSDLKFDQFIEALLEIGRMVGGWIKSL